MNRQAIFFVKKWPVVLFTIHKSARMNLIEIFKNLQSRYSSLSDECIEELLQNINIKSFAKNEIIVREGQFAKKVYFILQGATRAYYYTNDKDVSDWFAFENEFISPIVSFFSEKPSPHYIQVLQDAILVEISQETIANLSKKYPEIEKLIQKIVVEVMLRQQKRISSILFYSAEQKYLQLMQEYPHIVDRVPLTHIASHLGMTLETLSRVRKLQV